jgi:hypothetical protein
VSRTSVGEQQGGDRVIPGTCWWGRHVTEGQKRPFAHVRLSEGVVLPTVGLDLPFLRHRTDENPLRLPLHSYLPTCLARVRSAACLEACRLAQVDFRGHGWVGVRFHFFFHFFFYLHCDYMKVWGSNCKVWIFFLVEFRRIMQIFYSMLHAQIINEICINWSFSEY